MAIVACAFGQPRKEGEDFRASKDRRAGAVGRGRQQVFAHRQVGEDLAALRHQAEAEAGDAEGGQAIDLRAVELEAAPPRHQPMIECTVVVLPMPLRPISVTTSPGVDGELNAEQHLAHAVAGFNIGKL